MSVVPSSSRGLGVHAERMALHLETIAQKSWEVNLGEV